MGLYKDKPVYKLARTMTDDNYSVHQSIEHAQVARSKKSSPYGWYIYKGTAYSDKWTRLKS